jgi:outer membrane protein X
MKKLITLALVILAAQVTLAQKEESTTGRIFKKFKVDISSGYAKPQGSATNGGALFAIEPKYAVMDQLSIGLRMEVAVTVRIDTEGDKSSAKGNASYLLTGDYYLNNNKFRPFAGLGAGMYTTASVDESTVINTVDDIPTASKFGGMARAGFEYGHFRLGLEYNFVAEKAGYLGVKMGVLIGGGRK